jgi:hypothetical protein
VCVGVCDRVCATMYDAAVIYLNGSVLVLHGTLKLAKISPCMIVCIHTVHSQGRQSLAE